MPITNACIALFYNNQVSKYSRKSRINNILYI